MKISKVLAKKFHMNSLKMLYDQLFN